MNSLSKIPCMNRLLYYLTQIICFISICWSREVCLNHQTVFCDNVYDAVSNETVICCTYRIKIETVCCRTMQREDSGLIGLWNEKYWKLVQVSSFHAIVGPVLVYVPCYKWGKGLIDSWCVFAGHWYYVIPFIQCPLSMLRLVYGRKIQYVLLMIHFLHSGNCDKSQKNEIKAVWLSSLSLNTEYWILV